MTLYCAPLFTQFELLATDKARLFGRGLENILCLGAVYKFSHLRTDGKPHLFLDLLLLSKV